jgi:SAM-dependent methyltransferase
MTQELPIIFNRELYLARQKKASGCEALWDFVADELRDRLSIILKNFAQVLLISQSADTLHAALVETGKCAQIDVQAPRLNDGLNLTSDHYDAIFSFLDLQCVNDVPGYLTQLARSLKPDGLLLVAFFAGDTLLELREAWLSAELEVTGGVTPRVAPMIGTRELGGLLQRVGLALPVADIDHRQVRYSDVFALMREIKAFGFSNPLAGRSNRFVSQNLIANAAKYYHDKYAQADGRISATFEIAWATAWKPHASQQKPLKPGSATKSFLEALNPK